MISPCNFRRSSPGTFRVALRFILGTFVLIIGISAPSAQNAAPQCSEGADNLLGCIIRLVETTNSDKIAQVILTSPLRRLLEKLADEQDYRGTPEQLQKLKQWSRELKDGNPVDNREAIAVLDNAIGSHIDEIRNAVSVKAAATQALDDKIARGTDIHSLFVARKLKFLDSDKAKFYDRGPFEVIRLSFLANAIEEAYFIDKAKGTVDKNKLARELQIIDDISTRFNAPDKYAYLRVPQRELQINSNLFWRASILFGLGEQDQARDVLHDLALKTHKLDLDTKNPGHVYIYRVFNLPYQIIVQGRDNTGPIVEVNDPGLLNRYYNPAQLALVTCAHLSASGSDDGITQFVKIIKQLSFADYYVVAGEAQNYKALREFSDALTTVINNGDLHNRVEEVAEIVNRQGKDLYATIERGAHECGVADDVREQIYSPFRFQPEIRQIEGGDKLSSYLLLGGRLSSLQANTVLEFLTKSVFADRQTRATQEKLGVNNTQFVTRMRIDE